MKMVKSAWILEMNNLNDKLSGKAKEMSKILSDALRSVQASFPFQTHYCCQGIPYKKGICKVLDHGKEVNNVWVRYQENGNKIVAGQLIYTTNGGQQYRANAVLERNSLMKAVGRKPLITSLILWMNLSFLVSYPQMSGMNDYLNLMRKIFCCCFEKSYKM